MRKTVGVAILIATVALAWAQPAAPAKKKAPPKKTSTAVASPAKKKSTGQSRPAQTATARTTTGQSRSAHTTARTSSGTRSTTAGRTTASAKKAPPRTTWRNRQLAPTQDRYKEIQQALASKGYLKPEDVNGSWNEVSMDALKRFQTEQKLEPSGKINSLSLIALGLGPKHETAAPAPPAQPPPDGGGPGH